MLPVLCADGSPLGWGFYSPNSLIAVRLVAFGQKPPGARWIEERMEAAYSFRKGLPLDSDGFRLINAEGDFVPGLIVDLYGDTAVLSIHIQGIEVLVSRIVSVLSAHFPGVKVYLKRDEHYARVEKLTLASGYIAGEGEGTAAIREGKLKILVDFARGQKTGYYLDQRENRRLAALYAGNRNVLNLFAYTGSFALHAAQGHAARVVSVESSRSALELAERNAKLNPELPSDAFQWRREDVFSFLEKSETYDLIIVDPPPFARRKSEVEGAIRGYVSLNQQVIRLLTPGGYAFTFSCSGAVDRETFHQVLMEAAHRSGRRVRFIRELHADADHPVAAEHPEGEYLKGWLIHAE
jgi:23S rRNA (cytosine1962-C5)-methyltransferase